MNLLVTEELRGALQDMSDKRSQSGFRGVLGRHGLSSVMELMNHSILTLPRLELYSLILVDGSADFLVMRWTRTVYKSLRNLLTILYTNSNFFRSS